MTDLEKNSNYNQVHERAVCQFEIDNYSEAGSHYKNPLVITSYFVVGGDGVAYS